VNCILFFVVIYTLHRPPV